VNRTLLSALLLVAGCGATPSPDVAEDSEALGIYLNPFNLQIDSISPSTQVEGRPITINFHQTNRFLRSPRSGWVGVTLLPSGSPPVEDAGSQWQIVSLASGQVANGVVTVTAPPASKDSFVKLFYFETWNAGEFPTPGPHLAETAPQPLTVAARYSVDINWIRIGSTRTLWLADHVFADLALSNPISSSTGQVSLGALDTGVHRVWLQPAPRVDLVPFVSTALSYGYRFVNFDWWNSHCNGTLVDDVVTFTSAQAATLTAGGAHDETRNYRTGSPSGCNTSDYTINSQVIRHAFNDDVPVLVPSTVQMRQGGQVQFSAVNFHGPVTWSVTGGSLKGVIDLNGVFTATQPLDPHGVVTVVAVDNQQNVATAALGLAQ
jgi:hypothetical protein